MIKTIKRLALMSVALLPLVAVSAENITVGNGTTQLLYSSAVSVGGATSNQDCGQYLHLAGDGLYWEISNSTEKECSIVVEGLPGSVEATKQTYRLQVIGVDQNNVETVVESFVGTMDGSNSAFQQSLFEMTGKLPVGNFKFRIDLLNGGMWIHKAYVTDGSDCILLKAKANPIGSCIFRANQVIGFEPFEAAIKTTAPVAYTYNTDWISFANWTDSDGTVVGTDATLTQTITQTTTVTANYNVDRQSIPTAEGGTFAYLQDVANNVEMDYYSGDQNHGCIRSGWTSTYFITNQKSAIYKLNFQTCCGANAADGSTVTVDVIDADGNIVATGNTTSEYTGGWTTYTDNSITLNNPVMPGDYSLRFTFAHPSYTGHIINYRRVAFEKLAVVPETITLNKSIATMWVGDATETLTATLTPEDITEGYAGVVWTTSNEAVATVSETGVVASVAPGNAVITVTAEKNPLAKASCKVTVPQHVTEITAPVAAEVYAGENVTLDVAVAPANAANKTLAWTSSDEAVATVSADGVVTGKRAGTATVTVKAVDRNVVAKTITVTVKQKVTAITLNQTSATIYKNETLQLTATCAPADATLTTVTWSSSDPKVATVNADGLATAVAGGIATITATANDGKGASATCTVTVNVPVESVSLDKTAETVFINQDVQLTATVNPSDATDATVTWSTSDEDVATVTAAGLVHAVGAGVATITATSNYDNDKKAIFTLTVQSKTAYGTGANTLYFVDAVNDNMLGDNHVAWDNTTDKNWVANSIVLTDADKFECPFNVTAASLTYVRTFINTNWQSLYIPYGLPYDDWCDKACVAELAGVHTYEDSPTIIEFITVKSGELLPNTPYVIRALSASSDPVTFTSTNKILSSSPDEETRFISCSSPRWTYKFFGNYQPLSVERVNELQAKVLGEGKLIYSSTEVKPMRFYLVKEKSSNGYWGAPAMSVDQEEILIMIDGVILSTEETNSIFSAFSDVEEGATYTTQGIKVNGNHKGIVIKNGKKVFQK